MYSLRQVGRRRQRVHRLLDGPRRPLLGHSTRRCEGGPGPDRAGTHFGASHELEVRWAELVSRLVPSAELVRFTASGTEATHLAMRLARAYTGRTRKIVRSRPLPRLARRRDARASTALRRSPMSAGVPGVAGSVLMCPANDMDAVETAAAAATSPPSSSSRPAARSARSRHRRGSCGAARVTRPTGWC